MLGVLLVQEYLAKVAKAGFKQVEVVDETHLPEGMLDDPAAKDFVAEQKLTKQQIADLSDAVVSIKVSAIKP
jgi:hypothetical protein